MGSRRLVVWIMDQMAIRRARERRCRLLAGVHGAARQFGSSSTGAGRQMSKNECSGKKKVGSGSANCKQDDNDSDDNNSSGRLECVATVQETRPTRR